MNRTRRNEYFALLVERHNDLKSFYADTEHLRDAQRSSALYPSIAVGEPTLHPQEQGSGSYQLSSEIEVFVLVMAASKAYGDMDAAWERARQLLFDVLSYIHNFPPVNTTTGAVEHLATRGKPFEPIDGFTADRLTGYRLVLYTNEHPDLTLKTERWNNLPS